MILLSNVACFYYALHFAWYVECACFDIVLNLMWHVPAFNVVVKQLCFRFAGFDHTEMSGFEQQCLDLIKENMKVHECSSL